MNWKLVLALLAAWVVVFMCMEICRWTTKLTMEKRRKEMKYNGNDIRKKDCGCK
jgi:hypothetical protein